MDTSFFSSFSSEKFPFKAMRTLTGNESNLKNHQEILVLGVSLSAFLFGLLPAVNFVLAFVCLSERNTIICVSQ